jgi:hypothetical protein
LNADEGEHRTRARHEHETETRSQQEASTEIAAPPAGQAEEGTLEQLAEAGNDEARREDEEKRDRDVTKEVLRQSQLIEQPGGEQGEDREARDETGDDRIRPTPAARRATGENDRQYGQNAGRDRGDDARDEGDSEQDDQKRSVTTRLLRAA